MRYICFDENDTLNAGAELGKRLRGGDVVLLYGDLGAGKTVFTRGIARSLNINTEILSPTFTVMNEYDGVFKLCHYDAYRLKNGEEAVFAGVAEFIGDPSTVCVIEWPDNIADILPDSSIRVTIDRNQNEQEREITIKIAEANINDK